MSTFAAQLEFAIPAAVLTALVVCLLQPVYLLGLSRVRALADHHAFQFLVGALATFATWIAAIALVPALRPSGVAETAVSLMALGGTLVVYLQIWGFMTRGYTLGILLTLYSAGRPLTASEIRGAYRGGDGIDWIMRHRLGAMIAAGVIERRGDHVALTSGRGSLAARLYLFSVRALGLKRTG